MTTSEYVVGAAVALLGLGLLLAAAAVFAAAIHWSWVAKEWLAARIKVPHVERRARRRAP